MKINKKAWEEFENYDIYDIEQAKYYWDYFCGKLNIEKIREDLRLLDKKAEALQYQSTRNVPDEEESVADLAEGIVWAIDGLLEELEKIREIVDPLTNLVPDPDEEEEDEEENQENENTGIED